MMGVNMMGVYVFVFVYFCSYIYVRIFKYEFIYMFEYVRAYVHTYWFVYPRVHMCSNECVCMIHTTYIIIHNSLMIVVVMRYVQVSVSLAINYH